MPYVSYWGITAAPDSTSKVVLALYAMALYANSKLNAYAREYMQTQLHCHFLENDSPAAICNKKLPRI